MSQFFGYSLNLRRLALLTQTILIFWILYRIEQRRAGRIDSTARYFPDSLHLINDRTQITPKKIIVNVSTKEEFLDETAQLLWIPG